MKIPYPYSVIGFYEAKYNLKQTHDDMLALICTFDEFCRKHNIKYSLADGTLLGAVRHGDFIPWDDDADLMVTRQEYEKIRNFIVNDNSIRLMKIHFLDRITAPGYDKKKIYLDLFINDDMPANRYVFQWKKFVTRFLRCSFNNSTVRNVRHDKFGYIYKHLRSIFSFVLRILARCIICGRDVFELNDSLVKLGNYKSSGIYTRYTSRMFETNRRFNKESYSEGYMDIMFRGKKVMILKNADVFLHEMYGNYNILLPEEKRKPEHPVNMMDSPSSCIKWYN